MEVYGKCSGFLQILHMWVWRIKIAMRMDHQRLDPRTRRATYYIENLQSKSICQEEIVPPFLPSSAITHPVLISEKQEAVAFHKTGWQDSSWQKNVLNWYLNITRVSSTFAAGRMACAAPSWWTMGCTAILQQQFVSTCKLAVQEVITQLNFKIHLTRCALFLTLVWLSWRFLDCFLSCHCRKYWRLISIQDLIHWKWSVWHNIAGM